jgi:hypothetical protein
MNQEFKKIKSEGITRYVLENSGGGATAGGTSSASVGGGSYAVPMGGVQRRKPGQNLINQEAKEKEAPKPRNFVAKNAKMGGAGAHKDKKKEEKQGIVKHKKPFAEENSQLGELSKDTLKSYIPKRLNRAKDEISTDPDKRNIEKARRATKQDVPRAMAKWKDPTYGKQGMAEGSLEEASSDEAWELVGQPVPEIQQFVKQMGYGNDEQSIAKITSIIDRVSSTQIPATSIPKLKNLANKGNDAQTLKAIQQISGRPDAEQQYTKLMQARDAGEGRNRDVSGYIQYVKSGNYDPPVLLKLPTGVYVIGGRTRLYAALALGVPANVKIISANNFKQGVAEGQLNELDLFAKQKTYFKMGNGKWIVANYRNVGSLSGPAFDQQFFRSLQWLAPATSQALGLDAQLANKGPMVANLYDFTDANSLSHNNVNHDLIDAVQDWVRKNPPAGTVPSQQVAQNQQQGVAEGFTETTQQQQVRAAITKGMAKWDQSNLATYKSQPTNLHHWDPSGWASGQLKGINSIDPDGTVVIELDDTTTAGLVKKLATLGGMPGVKTRQLKMTFDPSKANAAGVTQGIVAEDITASSISSPHGPGAVTAAQRGPFAGLDAQQGDKADKETLAAYQTRIMDKQVELELAKKLGGVPPKFGRNGTGIFSGMADVDFPKWLEAHPQYVDAILGITGTATPNKSQNQQSQTVNVPPVPTAGQTSMTDYKSTPEGADGGEEYNDEVGMADSNIHTIIRSAKELIKTLEPMENMPEWAQDKLAQVKGMLVSVKDYVESQHEHGNIYHTNEGLGDDFTQFMKDKGIKHRVAGSPDQERQRTQDMMAQRAKDRANAPAPAAPSPQAIAQAKEKLAMLSRQFDPSYQYSDDHSFWTKQHALAQQIHNLEKFIARGEVGVGQQESAPPGWKGTVKAMKKHKDIDNPFALAWSMKNKGYKSHKPNVGEDAYIESLFAQLEERSKK